MDKRDGKRKPFDCGLWIADYKEDPGAGSGWRPVSSPLNRLHACLTGACSQQMVGANA